MSIYREIPFYRHAGKNKSICGHDFTTMYLLKFTFYHDNKAKARNVPLTRSRIWKLYFSYSMIQRQIFPESWFCFPSRPTWHEIWSFLSFNTSEMDLFQFKCHLFGLNKTKHSRRVLKSFLITPNYQHVWLGTKVVGFCKLSLDSAEITFSLSWGHIWQTQEKISRIWHIVYLKQRLLKSFIIQLINSSCNFSIQNCPQNSDKVQFRFQFSKLCVIKYLKNTKLQSIESLKTKMTSDPQTITEISRLTARILFLSLRVLTSFVLRTRESSFEFLFQKSYKRTTK